jgi:hypothetical protein
MIGKAKSEVKPIFDLINSLIFQSPEALFDHTSALEIRSLNRFKALPAASWQGSPGWLLCR